MNEPEIYMHTEDVGKTDKDFYWIKSKENGKEVIYNNLCICFGGNRSEGEYPYFAVYFEPTSKTERIVL